MSHKKDIQKPTLDYQGTILLQNDKGLQSIYYGQNYGTFYGIYLSFDCKRDGDIVTMNNLHFKIVNYKGTLNLGIVDIIFKIAPHEVEGQKPYLHFTVVVEALHPTREFDLLDDSGEKKEIEFNVNEVSNFVIHRALKEISSSDFYSKDRQPNDNPIFDNEFYYREGLHFDYNNNDNRQPARDGQWRNGQASSGDICYIGKHKLAL